MDRRRFLMANNLKVVNADELETALTNTADAIRAQTGSTDPITWNMRSGFSEAISGLNNATPDWNENDVTSKSYIQNRTHWVDELGVHPLDANFIPDTIARNNQVVALAPQTITAEQQAQVRANLNAAPKIQYGTEEVTDGSASPYPEGTLYVVIV
jgi:hypothetical protein